MSYTQEQKDNLVKVLFGGKAIRCKTKDQNVELSEILDDVGICWISGESMLQSRVWDNYREQTAYNYEVGSNSEGMMYSHAAWYKEHGMEVVDFDTILISEPQPTISLMEYLLL